MDTSIFNENHKMWSVPVCLKALSFVICAVGVIIWTYAVMCHADGIRLLADTDMNICHKVWYFSTVIPIQCTTNTQQTHIAEVWKLKENPTFGADLAHWAIIFGPMTQHMQGHQFYNRNNSGANFCHDNCTDLTKTRQALQGAVGLCKKKWHLREIIVLHFMLLRLSFRLWIWHREPHFLNGLLYIFIVIYAVSFHDQKLSFLVL